MQPLSPKSITSAKKNMSKGLERVTSQTYLQHVSAAGYGCLGYRQNSNDFNYALESYLLGKSYAFYGKVHSQKYIRSKRPLLADTEEKIFSEIIGLVSQIEKIKEKIMLELESIKQIQIQNPDIEQKLRYHGYSQPLTIQQRNDLEEENREIYKKIDQIQSKKEATLQAALAAEKTQYQQLKQELSQSVSSPEQNKAFEVKIKELKNMIHELQKDRKVNVRGNYPGIDKMKTENQDLRQKTIAFLKNNQGQTREQQELLEYLQREQRNRMEFMQELKTFKAEFKRMKQENESLRQRIRSKNKLNAKQNSGERHSTNKLESKKSLIQFESFVGKKTNMISQYQSFLRQLQQNNRK